MTSVNTGRFAVVAQIELHTEKAAQKTGGLYKTNCKRFDFRRGLSIPRSSG
jgi:hypothetical protein